MKSNDDDERRMTIEVDMEEQRGEQTLRIRVKDAIKVTASAVAATSLAMLAMWDWLCIDLSQYPK